MHAAITMTFISRLHLSSANNLLPKLSLRAGSCVLLRCNKRLTHPPHMKNGTPDPINTVSIYLRAQDVPGCSGMSTYMSGHSSYEW